MAKRFIENAFTPDVPVKRVKIRRKECPLFLGIVVKDCLYDLPQILPDQFEIMPLLRPIGPDDQKYSLIVTRIYAPDKEKAYTMLKKRVNSLFGPLRYSNLCFDKHNNWYAMFVVNRFLTPLETLDVVGNLTKSKKSSVMRKFKSTLRALKKHNIHFDWRTRRLAYDPAKERLVINNALKNVGEGYDEREGGNLLMLVSHLTNPWYSGADVDAYTAAVRGDGGYGDGGDGAPPRRRKRTLGGDDDDDEEVPLHGTDEEDEDEEDTVPLRGTEEEKEIEFEFQIPEQPRLYE